MSHKVTAIYAFASNFKSATSTYDAKRLYKECPDMVRSLTNYCWITFACAPVKTGHWRNFTTLAHFRNRSLYVSCTQETMPNKMARLDNRQLSLMTTHKNLRTVSQKQPFLPQKVKLPEEKRNCAWRGCHDIDERHGWTTALLTDIRHRLITASDTSINLISFKHLTTTTLSVCNAPPYELRKSMTELWLWRSYYWCRWRNS